MEDALVVLECNEEVSLFEKSRVAVLNGSVIEHNLPRLIVFSPPAWEL